MAKTSEYNFTIPFQQTCHVVAQLRFGDANHCYLEVNNGGPLDYND